MRVVYKFFTTLLLFGILNVASASDREIENEKFSTLTNANPNEIKQQVLNGADVNYTKFDGTTVLSYVTYYGSYDVMKTWVELGADVNKANRKGDTPLFFAVHSGSVQKVKFLLKYVNDIDLKNKYGNTVLLIATRGLSIYDHRIAIEIIEAGADVNVLDAEGNSPLNILRRRKEWNYFGQVEEQIEKLLISKGAMDISTFGKELEVN